MIEYLMDYARDKGYDGGIDEKGNVYMCKGAPPDGGYFPVYSEVFICCG
jgi:hypothetical protein